MRSADGLKASDKKYSRSFLVRVVEPEGGDEEQGVRVFIRDLHTGEETTLEDPRLIANFLRRQSASLSRDSRHSDHPAAADQVG